MMPSPRARWMKRLFIGGAMVISLGMVAPFGLLAVVIAQDGWEEWRRCRGHRQFDPTVWKNPTLALEPPYLRSCMVDNLLAQELLLQKTTAEVIALLGTPETLEHGFTEYDLVFVVGPERSFISIDYEWLLLNLDQRGRVEEARLMTD
ncbi:hypothetical protein [Phormidium sp. FACHB-1136]|uniref:hypothetical protein n=1 Tax=Phormidium sp. FACHB-1136 TaxID=2692848 RepID=UPI001683B9F7|nr:hypothetical protein [Phormidium sp. FACHB-1136]MBD2424976.1 hypothetical protein [Phormidium sp. FACHB-1136]